MLNRIGAALPHGVLAVVALASTFALASLASPVSPAAWERPASAVRDPASAALLHVTAAGDGLVAVGERGLVLRSADAGRHWTQSPSPVSVTLTRALFVSSRTGWAVGHGGVILHSDDGGRQWRTQLDGVRAARLAMAAYPDDGAAPALAAAARRLVLDGADKPFFDILFLDERNGFAVGAYGLAFRTADGGAHWTPWMAHLDNPEGLHLYGMARSGATLFIAGEQGLLLRSTDGGARFTRVSTPYQGSYFGVVAPVGGDVYLYGLRGNLYRSGNGGAAWQRMAAPSQASFSAALALTADSAVFADQAGRLYTAAAGDHALRPVPAVAAAPYTAIARGADGAWVLTSLRGISRVEPGVVPRIASRAPARATIEQETIK